MIWVQPSYQQHIHLEGRAAHVIPEELLGDLPALAIAAAGHVHAGRFKIASPAMERAQHLPLTGALNFRAGEPIDANSLRLAILAGIGLGLTPESASIRPVVPSA